MEQTGNHVQNNVERKTKAFDISESGSIGRKIFNDLTSGICDLKAVSGRIYIEVNLLIEDEKIFGDDEIRKSKLIIEIEMKNE